MHTSVKNINLFIVFMLSMTTLCIAVARSEQGGGGGESKDVGTRRRRQATNDRDRLLFRTAHHCHYDVQRDR